ncbi:hypothetical protein RJT34_14508 [Clitoria ternatea]|uniref:Wall-associated receptor kinase galacturonan-binding domain-containing protein n=1 Tax=Clitoria ternatea TaxID=43366 RepID=A0AAN9JT16_CLITE
MSYHECYADKWFEIECRNTSGYQIPYLKSKDVGGVINLEGGPFVYSQDYNKFVAVGCNNIAFLQSNGSEVSGCVSICDDNEVDIENMNLDNIECHGKYCCETSLPSYLFEFNATIEGLGGNDRCGYALIVKNSHDLYPYQYQYRNGYYGYDYLDVGGDIKHLNNVEAVLEWEILNNSTLKPPASSHCYPTNITSSQHRSSSGYQCYCLDGFGGNPYIDGGCIAAGMIQL